MQITLSPKLQADLELSSAVAGKRQVVESIIDIPTADAEWTRATNVRGNTGAMLHLRDRSGAESSAGFLPEDFGDETRFESRLRGLKDALLKVGTWRRAVDRLLTALRPWCESLPGSPAVRREPVRVVEAQSGDYESALLTLTRAGRTVRVCPIAAWVLGFDGQVNIVGANYRGALYYKRTGNEWVHVPDGLPYRELPLTESLFHDVVEACFDD